MPPKSHRFSSSSLFISIEGGDGAGKTTQALLLEQKLREVGLRPKLVQEPGSTQLGEYLRLWLKGTRGSDHPLNFRSELFLFAAARADLVNSVLVPFLRNPGAIVIADRYVDSTRAYQGYGRGIDREQLDAVNTLTIAGLVPDITILLDCPPSEALKRLGTLQLRFSLTADEMPISERRAFEGFRLEEESLEFHHRVHEGYLEMARDDPDRWRVIDATQEAPKIAKQVWAAVRERLAERDAE